MTSMKKVPFVTKAQVEEIAKTYPTPFYIYDEKGIRETARKINQAFSWNKGYKEYFAVKANAQPLYFEDPPRRRLRDRLFVLHGTFDE